METKPLKKFRLKCSLINLKTGEEKMCQDLVITGAYGNDAVSSFRNKLKEEGIYKLGDDYSYFEIGPVSD